MAGAADTTNVQAGGQSFLEGAGDALSYGVGAAVLSGLGSIYNTAAAGANLLGAGIEEVDTYKKLNEIDTNWSQYYKENQNAIDTVGFIGTSFIPGSLAIKGLNMARAGSGAGAFGRAMGFARSQQALSLDRALVELAAEGGTVFTRINKNKAAAMAWGFADQALTAAAFETGVALTMKQSPLLADDSWWDIGKTALVGTAFGGVIGGGIDSLMLSKSFKTAVKQLDSKQRGYDYIADLSRTNLDGGDKAFTIMDSLSRLPAEVLPEDKILDLSFHLSGGTTQRKVDISKILGNSLEKTNRTAVLDFETSLRELSSDSTVTQPFAEMALTRLSTLQKSGADATAIRESMGDLLFELKAVRPATVEPTVAASDLWYFKKALTKEELSGLKTLEDWEAAIKDTTPFDKNAYRTPYVFKGTPEQKVASFSNAARIGTEGADGFPNLSAAWKAGRDVAFMPDGTLRVNDASKLWKRVEDPVYSSSRYLNTRTGAVTGDTVLTAADSIPAGKSFEGALKKDAVYLPTKDGVEVVSMKEFNAAGDTTYFTARHAWASKLADKDLPSSIEVTDFSLMDRLRGTVDPKVLDEIEIVTSRYVPGSLLDTRKTGVRLHGSSNKVNPADFTADAAYSGSANNIYGMGMYTTNAADIAAGYMKKGKGKAPSLYTTEHARPVKLYNMENNLTREQVNKLDEMLGSTGIDTSSAKTLREWFDEVRAESRGADVSMDEVQEIFDSVRTWLESQGYRGFAHIGGANTGSKAHSVAIYWHPEQDLKIAETALDKFKSPGSMQSTVLGTASEIGISDTIKATKLSEAQRLFTQAAEVGKTLDVRAVAYQLNVNAKWLEEAVANRFTAPPSSAFGASSDAGVSLPLDNYLRRENLIADFARPQQFSDLVEIKPGMSSREKVKLIQDTVATNGGQFVTGELAWAYRVQQAIAVTKTAGAVGLGDPARTALLPDLAQTAAKLADSTGIGATVLGSSNANYGEVLKLAAQDTGKHVHKWIQEDVGTVVDALSSTSLKLRNSPTAAAELGVITNLLRASDDKYVWAAANPKQLILRELQKLEADPVKLAEGIASATGNGTRAVIDITDDTVVDFLKTHTKLNEERLGKRTVLNSARGFTSNIQAGTVYVPPVDTTYFQHFAFVRPKEGKAFSTSEVSMIFGRNADELSKRLSSVDQHNFDVITKQDTEKYFKAKEAYDFDLTINEPRINSELRRTGALNNMQPEVRAENLVEDYMRWHQNQASRLVRDSVETYYAQQVAELRKLGETYNNIATSKFAGSLRKSKTEITNPYDDYIKTMLDVSKRSEYTFLHQANEFVDALGTRAYQAVQSVFGDAQKGIVTYEQANAQMEKFGIKGVYNNREEFFTANAPRDRNIVREYVSKANMFLANSVLRLDFFNSIVNVVSTPMMLGTELASIRNLAKSDPALAGKLSELMSVAVPGGGGAAVPSTTKLIAKAVSNYFGADKEQLLTRYMANGDVKDSLSQFHSMLDSLALRADFKVFSDNVTKWTERGARVTLNEQAEQMTRFISADVMRQVTDPLLAAGKLSLKEQNAYISVFVNRVQGNYISSQRPIVFQGVLGSAVSLFQTYSFNLMQQLLRHVENGDKKAVATLFGMQAGTFGLNGTPFFEAVNTHIIGNSSLNQGHYDAYSVAPAVLGKDVGDWLMYGTASAFPAFTGGWPALYTRGDINPRHMTILPLNPMDVPAVDASIRIVKNIADVGSKLVGGADISTTLLQGLEHNGINRPLAGFAQVMAGQSTTSKGSLISASNEFSLVTTAARIAGAKPMDEAVALNNMYRMQAYRTANTERMDHLGEKVKSYLGNNQFPPDEVMDTFMKNYAKAGGRVENFNAALQHWAKEANQSVVEKMRNKLNSPYGQRLNEIMGGEGLQDYSNAPPPVLDQPIQ